MDCAPEFGSFFALDSAVPTGGPPWVPPDAALYGCGRDALRAVVAHGKARGWRRLYLPTYYCHDVTDVSAQDIDVRMYPHAPFEPGTALRLGEDEAAVVVEYFGMPCTVQVSGGAVVLDRTHDWLAPWTYARTPDYVFASLRKTLPLPDGGIACAAGGQRLPQPGPTDTHVALAARLAAAMAMKEAWLRGAPLEKARYLALARDVEAALGRAGEVSGPCALTRALAPAIDLHHLRRRRLENGAIFSARLAALCGPDRPVTLLRTPAYPMLRFATRAAREACRAALIAARIYPAVLWPVERDGVPAAHRALSGELLALHVDYRYGVQAIACVAQTVAGLCMQDAPA
ncbi:MULTISPECIES: hypothetical protein [Cupriavidus]|uniref:hypothetical protein n=1 Tax=Cupriavidus sp. DF5525 TaxID=3160989 RepID=UPI0003B0D8F9|nr:hypothetical protein N234_21095 [Ralstonia pickettii DTP0602]